MKPKNKIKEKENKENKIKPKFIIHNSNNVYSILLSWEFFTEYYNILL